MADATVAIRVLGRFEVSRGGVPVADAEWQSRKARELLKILVARRGRAMPRGRLVQLLWPEEDDPAVLANRLSVALATVRRVLGSAGYVLADSGSVTLAVSRIDVDVESFLRDASIGLAARSAPLLRQAAAAYRGDVLEEDVYADWAHALREEARAACLAVLRALASTAAASGATDQAVLLLLRLLCHDPYDEPAHRALVSALAKAGRWGDAARANRCYQRRMAELGIRAAPVPGLPRPGQGPGAPGAPTPPGTPRAGGGPLIPPPTRPAVLSRTGRPRSPGSR
jgi:DNA-binding SARP family transcriptional activator